ncbi:hypothetical protein D9C73_020024 [Collichthys lucidus]|uniref:Uncharacterized protein n=1 Tax=Collichthys lucidus TaxID=240159 RepID=A0A4U5VBS0_COLLU|nr:hypothetical protein D9C73_020024 [Collichthys lucidus]
MLAQLKEEEEEEEEASELQDDDLMKNETEEEEEEEEEEEDEDQYFSDSWVHQSAPSAPPCHLQAQSSEQTHWVYLSLSKLQDRLFVDFGCRGEVPVMPHHMTLVNIDRSFQVSS